MQAISLEANQIAEEEIQSTCTIKATYKGGLLYGLFIQLRGVKFPSKNAKRVYSPRPRFSRFARGRISTPIRMDDKSRADLQEISHRYRAARGSKTISFHDSKIEVAAILPQRRRSFDTHNYNESISDWMQAIGIVNNDSQIDIKGISMADYPSIMDHIGAGMEDSPDCTTLICLRRDDQICRVVEAHIVELARIAAGKINLIG